MNVNRRETSNRRSTAISSGSMNSGGGTKYNGLIQISKYKIFLKDLGFLFSYVQITSPHYSILHKVITIIRLLQIVGPSLNFNNKLIWPKGTIAGSASSWASLFFQIVPADYVDASRRGFSILFIVLAILMIIFVIVSSSYYKKNANLSPIVSNVIFLYYSIFPHIMQLPVANNICVNFSQYAFFGKELSTTNWVIIIFSICVIFIQTYFVMSITRQTIAIYFVILVISTIVFKIYTTRSLMLLDRIQDDIDEFDNKIKYLNVGLNLMQIGFKYGHCLCVDFRFCKLMIEKWKLTPDVWFAYAKYSAIFPEENTTLEMIFIAIHKNKIKGSLSRSIKTQCIFISKMRENTLSNTLKSKINKIAKQTNGAKHKLRHVWDVVIQGNMGEIENATKRAISTIDHVDAEYKRLLREYPNNRFVTRSYSRFLFELKADYQGASDMVNKTRLLQRGITVNEDYCHNYGMSIFSKIPAHIQLLKNGNDMTESNLSFASDIEAEENMAQINEESQILSNKIENLRIPGTSNTIILRILLLILVFIIPIIGMIIGLIVFIKNLAEPIPYLRQLVALRNRLSQIAAFSLRYLCIQKGYLPNVVYRKADPPDPVGGTWDLREQISYVLSEATRISQQLNLYQKIGINDVYLHEVYKVSFTSSLKYYFYTKKTNYTIYQMSFQGISIDYVVQISAVLNMNLNESDIRDSSYTLNLIKNTYDLIYILRECFQKFTLYYNEIDDKAVFLMKILLISLLLLSAIVFISSAAVEVYWLQNSKKSAYKCIMSLPKNCISQLTESLRAIKKEVSTQSSTDTNEEINKQEENILKVFSSGGMSSTKYGDIVPIVIITVFVMGMNMVCFYLFSNAIKQLTLIMLRNAPHLINAGGAYAGKQASIYYLDLFILSNSPGEIDLLPPDKYAQYVTDLGTLSNTLYQALRYGDTMVKPFQGFASALQLSKDAITCEDKYAYQSTYIDVTSCFDADMVFSSISVFVDYVLSPYFVTGKDITPDNAYVSNLWTLLVFPLYTHLFMPILDDILPEIGKSSLNEIMNILMIVLPLAIISILFEIVAVIWTKHIESHIRAVLKLLLHCPPDVVISNSKIMKVLSGNLSAEQIEITSRDNSFYDNLLENLSQAIVYTDQNGIIEQMNKQCRKIFNVSDEDEYKGKQLKDFLNKFEGDIESILSNNSDPNINNSNNNINNVSSNTIPNNTNLKNTQGYSQNLNTTANYQTNSTATILSLKLNDEKLMFRVVKNICNQKLVITLQDVTAANRYQNLINEERAKSDQLLSSILPPSLVSRVQSGETNISFAVQSVTILFLDIVSFTQWCGNLPADKVLKTLNLMFKKLDLNVAKNPTMMKIKCIGDCYMAAGGVFSKVNQPAEHAKEGVNFGLDALDSIQEINKELNESLQIRVGINTGGPIVAGVLGIGKPTFEILGPAINMAQEMQDNGIPMKVHISRNVYELVYGDSFDIQERGTVEVKGGSVVTYLVNGRKNQKE
ncbi:guanylate cyclase [Tritrichomonas foetus]|uniref:Guanylate cyclase n=1 Tax=Tritrichomonas foetus TaxID=1144522 RepID=A0A1J4KY87_9EUKA|nr:guanylate cyclase [Tritrichomonas foetus]|eukprot:OHT14517.1 guanylate cyclase [Tritrichomonas foetus]